TLTSLPSWEETGSASSTAVFLERRRELREGSTTCGASGRKAGLKYWRTSAHSVCGASGDVSPTPATHPKTNCSGRRSSRRACRDDWQNGLSLENRCYCDRNVGSANHSAAHP